MKIKDFNKIDFKTSTRGGGLETEISVPYYRGNITTITGEDYMSIPPQIDFSQGYVSQLDKLGVTRFKMEDMGGFRIASMTDAAKVDEETDFPEGNIVFNSSELGMRIGIKINITSELLASGQINEFIQKEYTKSIDRALFHYVVNEVYSLSAKTGFDTGDTDVSLTTSGLTDFEGDLENYEGGSFVFLTSTDVKKGLKQSTEDSGGNRIWLMNQMIDLPAVGTKYLPNETLILGDWSNCYIKEPEQISVSINPYTKSDTGIIILSFYGMFKVGIIDKNAFIVAKNIVQ